MYSKQHVDEAWEENLILAQAWEDYAYELALQGASREDINICCDEAELHWEWVQLWQEYYYNLPCLSLSEQELEDATLSNQELDALQQATPYEQAIDFLYACYRLTADAAADYPAYV